MKNGWMGKMLRAALAFTCAAALVGLCGCSASKDDGKKVKDLEFAVVGEPDIRRRLRRAGHRRLQHQRERAVPDRKFHCH